MKRRVIVDDYNPAWKTQFDELDGVFNGALGSLAVRVDHVGSTSVPGLSAKPILDVVVVIEARAALPAAIERLAELGYEHEGDLGVPGREAFGPGDGSRPIVVPRRTWPRHHLYVCEQLNAELARQLVFRDWLRGHPADARRYAVLKCELAELHPYDVNAYADGKASFVGEILDKAVRSEARAHEAGPTAPGAEE